MTTPPDWMTRLVAATAARADLGPGLAELLRATGATATGVWRVEGSELACVGFQAGPEMPPDVAAEFAAATRRVSLSQTGLGIVQAIVTAAPALSSAGSGSASGAWLARFQARQSLAVPSGSAERPCGVVAISTAQPLTPGDAVWSQLLQFAALLGPALSAPQGGERLAGMEP